MKEDDILTRMEVDQLRKKCLHFWKEFLLSKIHSRISVINQTLITIDLTDLITIACQSLLQIYWGNDTWANVMSCKRVFKRFYLVFSKVILVAVQDEGSRYMNYATYNAFKKIGAKNPRLRFRSSFALIGFSGQGRPRWVKQVCNQSWM